MTNATNTPAVVNKPIREVLDSVLLIQLEPRIWSGRKKLRPEDLTKVQSSDLPPTELASLGAKKIMDLENIKVFEKLKKRAIRACEIAGVRFLGGYAVPLTKAQDVAKELDKIEAEYLAEKKAFLDNYDTNVNDWIAAHPDWEHCLRSAITPKPLVEAAISFSWQAIQVREPKGKAKALTRGLDKEVNGLSDQLFIEIGNTAQDMLENVMFGRDKVTQKALYRVRQVRDKLHDLSFLSPNVNPLVKTLDYTLAMMPKTGNIEGAQFSALYGMLSLLANPDKAKEHGKLINAGTSVEDAVDGLLGGQPTVSPSGSDSDTTQTPVQPAAVASAPAASADLSAAVVPDDDGATQAPPVEETTPAQAQQQPAEPMQPVQQPLLTAAVVGTEEEDEETCL